MNQLCYFISTSSRNRQVPNYFFAIADKLGHLGHQVVVLIDGQAYERENHQSNPAIYTWPSKRPTGIRDAQFLYRLIKYYRPQCLVGQFGSVNLNIIVGWLMRVPYRVAWYRTMSAAQKLDTTNSHFKQAFLKLRKRLVYQLATHVMANTEAASLDVQQIYNVSGKKCYVFNTLISDPITKKTKKWRKLGDKVVCVGRLYPTKGQDTLIRAIPYMKQALPDIKVEFLGDGPSKANYVKLAAELGVEKNCNFVGSVDRATVFEKMASAMVTVVPSRSEAFGLVNAESLAVGTPVVASNVGGIPEIVQNGKNGFLVPSEDSYEFAKKVILLVQNLELNRQFGQNARDYFVNRFSMTEENISHHASWYENIVLNG